MNQERVFQILIGPHMSEKAATVAEDDNQYVFKVALDATKSEIKTSVEQLFEVKVDEVRTLRVKGKSKRTRTGWSTDVLISLLVASKATLKTYWLSFSATVAAFSDIWGPMRI